MQVTSLSLRKISAATGIYRYVVGELKELLRVKDDDPIFRMLQTNGLGRKTVLSEEEERMIVNRLCFAAGRGLAVDHDGIKRIMARVAWDGRRGWRNNLPSDDAVRASRARHRDITFRKAEKKKLQNARPKAVNMSKLFYSTEKRKPTPSRFIE